MQKIIIVSTPFPDVTLKQLKNTSSLEIRYVREMRGAYIYIVNEVNSQVSLPWWLCLLPLPLYLLPAPTCQPISPIKQSASQSRPYYSSSNKSMAAPRDPVGPKCRTLAGWSCLFELTWRIPTLSLVSPTRSSALSLLLA